MRILSGDRFWRTAGFCLALGLTVSGCVTPAVHKIKPTSGQGVCVQPAPDREVLVGLAVSGGGSRAALFAASAYETLSQLRVGPEHRSLLEQVSYVSSVSGGSLASAYYTMKKPAREVPMLTPDGQLTEAYKVFFAEFKEMMARDYERPLFWKNLLRLRWFNPSWTAVSLKEVLQDSYLGELSFRELGQREARGDSPYFLINTTLYNDGRRVVLSSLDRDALRYDLVPDLKKNPAWENLNPEVEQILRTSWDELQSRTPEDLKLDQCQLKVAAAVAASMSFPPIIGPFTVGIEEENQYWHIGDGGMSDNTGAESLLMVFLKQLQEGRAKRAVIIALDSSFPFDVGGEELNQRKEGFSFFDKDYSRIPSIMEERSLAYRALFFRVAQLGNLLPGSVEIVVVRLKHTDAQWKDDLSDLPESCRKEGVDWKSPQDVTKHVSGVVTRLFLKSTCDRDLVVQAAQKVIAQHEPEIRNALGEGSSHRSTH
jgi:predicted acylesterase/phospholipase RssA